MKRAAADTLADDPFDQAFLPGSFYDDGLQHDVAPDALWCGSGRCNIAGHGRIYGRSRKWHCIHANGKTVGGEHLQRLVSSSPKGETGQMAADHGSLMAVI
jgi:hypothetical protein